MSLRRGEWGDHREMVIDMTSSARVTLAQVRSFLAGTTELTLTCAADDAARYQAREGPRPDVVPISRLDRRRARLGRVRGDPHPQRPESSTTGGRRKLTGEWLLIGKDKPPDQFAFLEFDVPTARYE